VRQTFNPEFINRLDEIIVFDELGDQELIDVLQLQIDQLNHTMSNHGFIVRLVDEAKQWILNKTCADRSYGARPLRRALQKHVEDPLSEALIQGQLGDASLVEMYVDGDELSFRSIMIDEDGIEQPSDLVLT
jgi:ATP-dependent Clp protease ATP-binding subunit ClpC